jgi:hypothetical protein
LSCKINIKGDGDEWIKEMLAIDNIKQGVRWYFYESMRGISERSKILRTDPELHLTEISPPFYNLIIIQNLWLILTNDESMIN